MTAEKNRLLTFAQLSKDKGINFSRVHVQRLRAVGKFPEPVHIGDNRIAWLESEIDAWVDQKASQRKQVAA